MNTDTDTVVGIDLGTTNSSVAVVRDGKPEVLRGGDDGLVPSCVALDQEQRVIVGSRARNQAALFPERTVLSVKRRMGKLDRIRLGSAEYSPQQISAFILNNLAERARTVLGHAISRAVITVPAYFTDAQRKATREAGEIAGLRVERIINEPTAASLAYDIGHQEAAKILVYDLGGGTFDVSVVATENGVVEVLSSAGNNRLGGDDFDALIVERLNRHLESDAGAASLRKNRAAQARLLHAAERAKRKLSSEPFVTIEEDNLALVSGKPVHLSYELSRIDFEEALLDPLQGSLHQVTKALNDAGVRSHELDRVLLVGGSTRIPLVTQLLQERLGMTPHGEVDPDRCVALGAAMQAGLQAGVEVGTVLVDITPYTFGTTAVGELDGIPTRHKFVPIIPRNSKLPVTKSEVFYALTPEQEAVQVEIFQGEDPDARNNSRIGSFRFEGLNKDRHAYDDGIVFTYSLNVDGILEFSARERGTGKEITGKVADALGAQHDAFEEPAWTEPAGEDAKPGANAEEARSEETERLLERAKAAVDTAHKEDLEELERLSRELRRAVQKGDKSRVDALAVELAELLFFVE